MRGQQQSLYMAVALQRTAQVTYFCRTTVIHGVLKVYITITSIASTDTVCCQSEFEQY